MYRPWTRRLFGIELEMREQTRDGSTLTADMIQDAVRDVVGSRRMSDNTNYRHSTGRTWDVKSDSSCGWEVASPAFRMNDEADAEEVRRVVDAVKALNPLVDRLCGFHVHLDCSDYQWVDLQGLVRLWTRYEPFFFEVVPQNRHGNRFARRLVRERWDQAIQPTDDATEGAVRAATATIESVFTSHLRRLDRYTALNTSGWWMHKRVEVRLHQGTMVWEKVRYWTMLMAALVQRVKETQMPAIRPLESTEAARALPTAYIMKQLGLLPSSIRQDVPPESVQLAGWLNARRAQFNPTPPTSQGVTLRPPVVRSRWRSGQFDASIQAPRCAALGVACPNPRLEGYRVCREHLDDTVHRLNYRLIRSQAASATPEVSP